MNWPKGYNYTTSNYGPLPTEPATLVAYGPSLDGRHRNRRSCHCYLVQGSWHILTGSAIVGLYRSESSVSILYISRKLEWMFYSDSLKRLLPGKRSLTRDSPHLLPPSPPPSRKCSAPERLFSRSFSPGRTPRNGPTFVQFNYLPRRPERSGHELCMVYWAMSTELSFLGAAGTPPPLPNLLVDAKNAPITPYNCRFYVDCIASFRRLVQGHSGFGAGASTGPEGRLPT